MQVSDIIATAVAKVGLAPADAVPTALYALALKFLNRVYEDVWGLYPFRDEKVVSLAVTIDESEMVFPEYVEAVRSLRTADRGLLPLNEIFLSDTLPEVFDDTGANPTNFWNLPDAPVQTQPASASAITVVSDATGDTTGSVRVFGTVSDLEAHEDLDLNGTNDVTGSLSFSEIKAISKPETTGRITVTAGATTLGTLAPWADRGAYRRIRIYPEPTDTVTAYVEALRRFPRLTSDHDTILIHRAESAIVDLFEAELCEYDERGEEAAAKRVAARERLLLAMEQEKHRDSEDNRTFPAVGFFGIRGAV